MHNGKLSNGLANSANRSDGAAVLLLSLSIFNIFLWLLCTTFSAMILIRFNSPNSLIKFASLDLISPGVWGSLFYGLGGILGTCAAYERRQSLMVSTLVLAMLSIFSSLGIAAVSGPMAIISRFHSSRNATWQALEYTLLILSVLGFLTNLAAFFAVSILICRSDCSNNTRPSQKPQPPPQIADNVNNNHLINSNYMNAEMTNSLSRPAPPPPGFILGPPQPNHPVYSSSLPQIHVTDTNM